MLKYILSLEKAAYQGKLEKTETKRKYADDSYKGKKKVTEFNIQLAGNQYTNFHNIHLRFPIKIKSAAESALNELPNLYEKNCSNLISQTSW